MELSLIHNDPAQTLLVTRDGIPTYSISTRYDNKYSIPFPPTPRRMQTYPNPRSPNWSSGKSSAPSASDSQNFKVTTVTRLERGRSAGRAQVEVGRLIYRENVQQLRDEGIRVCLMGGQQRVEYNLALRIPKIVAHGGQEVNQSLEEEECTEIGQTIPSSWSFTGPDKKSYKWQIFIQYPVLILNDNTQTPVARYRRAKLGIISRQSRKAFLEIYPAGINCLDMIVVTFVSFMVYEFPPSPNDSDRSNADATGSESVGTTSPGPEFFTSNFANSGSWQSISSPTDSTMSSWTNITRSTLDSCNSWVDATSSSPPSSSG
ncbi:hypothetical protein VKT23_009888 [Stygiomarasmius scandens]|uniref:DUF6593 domain-containing protein n=1 Tax=Marasmiellus scandens TaxID=2682957 RepID=A0ABR1JJH9_9AGAR